MCTQQHVLMMLSVVSWLSVAPIPLEPDHITLYKECYAREPVTWHLISPHLKEPYDESKAFNIHIFLTSKVVSYNTSHSGLI